LTSKLLSYFLLLWTATYQTRFTDKNDTLNLYLQVRSHVIYVHKSYSNWNENYIVGFGRSCQLKICKAHFCSSNGSEVTAVRSYKVCKIDRTYSDRHRATKITPFNPDFYSDSKMVRHITVPQTVQKLHL
jgi:hypothetical protein